MTVDPRWSFWLSVTLAIVGFLSGAGAQFTNLGLTTGEVNAVLALCSLTLGVGNAVNAVLAAIPSKSGQSAGFYLGPKQQPQQPPAGGDKP